MRTILCLATIILAALGSVSVAHAANQPPNAPMNPDPDDGATDQYTQPIQLTWQATDPDGDVLVYDLYFGADPSPSLLVKNLSSTIYYPGTLSFNTTYWWRIVARDPSGLERSSPTWSFSTKDVNEPPRPPVHVQPYDGTTNIPVKYLLGWYGMDPEANPLNYDLYFGTDADPPLVADHLYSGPYDPGVLAISTKYYWRVVSRDTGGLETSGPTWTFTTAASSTLPPVMPWGPTPPHNQGIGADPLLQWHSSDPDGDLLTYDVFVGRYDPSPSHPLIFMGTTTQKEFQVSLIPDEIYFWQVKVHDSYWTITSPVWRMIAADGYLPVLFSRFDAQQRGDDVEVGWSLQSDDAMESYTLYRRDDKAGAPVVIANAPVQNVESSYIDHSVQAGKTYHYELLIRTKDGDEFRSQPATVTMAERTLTLYQNVPNPFNPQTTIRYDLPTGSTRVQLSIFDATGGRVRTLVDEVQTAGSRSAVWNGRDDSGNAVASGVYFYALDAGKQRLTRKLVLLK